MTSREIKKEGFTEIYNGLGKPECDVVFVHGLQGDPVKTWTCEVQNRSRTKGHTSTKSKKILGFHRKPRENGGKAPEPTLEAQTIEEHKEETYWPRDLLPTDFPNARVLTYGYDSHISHFFRDAVSQNNIMTLGRDLLHNLVAYRVDEPTRPLFFVCHSLGGLVVKEALRRSANASDIDTDLLNILESTFALIFFGTPHRGGNYTHMGLTAARVVSAAGFSVNFQNLRDLSGDSGILELLREEFGKLLDRGAFLITSFQEGKGFTRHGLLDGKIVENESSGLDHKFERKHTIQRNHVDMCRFVDADDEGYRQFKEELKRHITRMGHNRAQELRNCMQSLYIPDMYIRAEQIDLPDVETLQWLYVQGERGPGFVRWLKGSQDSFWIQGKPASGKSTVMKHIVTNQETAKILEGWIIVGLFFSDRGGQMARSWIGMLRSMLYQLVSQVPRLLPTIVKFCPPPRGAFNFSRSKLEPIKASELVWTIEKLEAALLACKHQQKVRFGTCFFIDALDEHEGDHKKMGNFLRTLANSDHSSPKALIKVCVASRPLNELADLFDDCPGFRVQDWTVKDINRVISERFKSHPRIRILLKDKAHIHAINLLIKKINERADGVFLWVRLVIDDLSRGITNGESIEALESHLNELPDDLNEFYRHMLSKIDRRYSRQAFIMFEAVLRARRPLTVVQMALVLYSNAEGHMETMPFTGCLDISNPGATPTPCLDSSTDMERQIRSYSGGILELKSPPTLPGLRRSLEPSSSDSSLSSQNSESDSVADLVDESVEVADSESVSGIGQWTVLPLHRTALEFLRQPENLTVVITAQTSSKRWKPCGDGHFYILSACQAWLRLTSHQEAETRVYSDEDIVMDVAHHCHWVERMEKGIRSYPWPEKQYHQLLDRIDAQLCARSDYKDCWPYFWAKITSPGEIQKQWRFDFVAFAVLLDMPLLVERRIKEGTLNVNREYGLPLLHFSVVCFDHWPRRLRPAMTKLLLDRGAAASRTYRILDNECKQIDSLAFLLFSCKRIKNQADADDVEQVVRMLVRQGANPNGKLGETKLMYKNSREHIGEPVLLLVAKLGLPPYNLLAILKEMIAHGADPNAQNAEEKTLLDILFTSKVALHFDGWLWLLDHGARITKLIVQVLYSENYSEHALRDPTCRKQHYYNLGAKLAALEYNPSWRTTIFRRLFGRWPS